MIFVTAGTTMAFPSLIQEVDRLAGSGFFSEEVICQIGPTDYSPRNCESFRFKDSLDNYFDSASIVITHGGSTIFSLLSSHKLFIAFPNPIGADLHQHHLLRSLSQQVDLYWSENTADLKPLFRKARHNGPAAFNAPKLGDDLKEYILSASTET